MNADITPPRVERDAAERAWRTWMQGLAVDVAAGVGVALVAGVAGGIEWTHAYWIALALAVGKSSVTAALAYFARKFVPPTEGAVIVDGDT